MDNSTECLNMNEELWLFREDYTTIPAIMGVFGVFYFIVIVFGVTGNICVLLAISRNKSLQTVPNMFIFSLSCSDLVVCCTSATITPITAFRKEWLFGPLLCSIAPFIAGLSLCFSTFTLTAISIDRYRLIRYPTKKGMDKTQTLCVIAATSILSAAVSAPTMLKQKLGPFENFCGEYCTEDWQGDNHGRRVYGAILLIVQFVIPLSIIILSYTAISLRIGQSLILKGAQNNKKSHAESTAEWHSTLTEQQRLALKRRQRTNRMLIGMVVAFSSSWIWSVAYNVSRDYEMLPDYVLSQEYLFGIATHCMAMTSTVWNPLLYAMLNLQFRKAFLDLMPERLKNFCGLDDVAKKASSPLVVNHAHAEMHFQAGHENPRTSHEQYGEEEVQKSRSSSNTTKYGATAEISSTERRGSVSASLKCAENSTASSALVRKASVIRGMQVLVSRLSASFIDSTASSGIDEQYAPLIEDSSNSSSSFSGPQVQETVSFCSSESPTRERRGSIYVVMRQRAPSYTPSFNNCVTITRINSF